MKPFQWSDFAASPDIDFGLYGFVFLILSFFSGTLFLLLLCAALAYLLTFAIRHGVLNHE
jgi:hypothetical protein